jgi:hypothetical protein
MTNEDQAVDLSALKQLSSLVQSRNLFFIPFYGTFLVFLVTQNGYISGASLAVKILIVITFLVGIYYASVVSDYLGYLEMFIFLQRTIKRSQDEEFLKSYKALGDTIVNNIKWEHKIFSWTMKLLWTTTIFTLLDMYFGKFIEKWTGVVLSIVFSHVLTK